MCSDVEQEKEECKVKQRESSPQKEGCVQFPRTSVKSKAKPGVHKVASEEPLPARVEFEEGPIFLY